MLELNLALDQTALMADPRASRVDARSRRAARAAAAPRRRARARGRLKIFFGASAGVGKTYAMLEAARRAGGRASTSSSASSRLTAARETAALLEGLELLPREAIDYRGIARSPSSISTPRWRASQR